MSDNEIEYGPDIMTLMDEDGQEHEFEVVDSIEEDDNRYLALVPVFENADESLDDSGELVILKVVEDDGEEFLEPIQDEDEFNKISSIFMERLEDEFDFED